jgi:hypothetical protein
MIHILMGQTILRLPSFKGSMAGQDPGSSVL